MDFYGNLMGVAHRIRELYMSMYKRMGRGIVVYKNVLRSTGPEHDTKEM